MHLHHLLLILHLIPMQISDFQSDRRECYDCDDCADTPIGSCTSNNENCSTFLDLIPSTNVTRVHRSCKDCPQDTNYNRCVTCSNPDYCNDRIDTRETFPELLANKSKCLHWEFNSESVSDTKVETCYSHTCSMHLYVGTSIKVHSQRLQQPLYKIDQLSGDCDNAVSKDNDEMHYLDCKSCSTDDCNDSSFQSSLLQRTCYFCAFLKNDNECFDANDKLRNCTGYEMCSTVILKQDKHTRSMARTCNGCENFVTPIKWTVEYCRQCSKDFCNDPNPYDLLQEIDTKNNIGTNTVRCTVLFYLVIVCTVINCN